MWYVLLADNIKDNDTGIGGMLLFLLAAGLGAIIRAICSKFKK